MTRPIPPTPRLLAPLLCAWALLNGSSCHRAQPDDMVSVTLAISLDGADTPPPLPGSSSSGSFGTSSSALNATEVSRIRVDVEDEATGTPWSSNFDLTKNQLNQWTGTLPFLPRNKALVFRATATGGPDGTVLFRGSTHQTLTGNNLTVPITLVPTNDGASVALPRIKQITLPREVVSNQSNDFGFLVEANASDVLGYTITADAAPNSGAFRPASGTLTLSASSGTFVIQYLAPTVSTATDFVHSVKVTNATGNSVTTTFKVQVKPPGTTEGVRNTTVQVLFNPVFQHLASSRAEGSTDVRWEATVVDDKPESQLTYVWTFKPEGSDVAETLPSTGNRATLQNYSVALTGELVVAVTDSDGGTTTLKHTLPVNQFPDDAITPIAPTGINKLAAGSLHTCALMNDGSLRCWGYNANGQLGQGHALTLGLRPESQPYTAGPVPSLERTTHVAAGGHHTCAVLSMGIVRCWGFNGYGQLGYRTSWNGGDDETVDMLGYVNLGSSVATKAVAGYGHTCALLDTGNLRCWGLNDRGQLGINSQQNIGDDELPSTDVMLGGLPVKDVVAGGYHTCALLENGKVRCWGANDRGQLGIGGTADVWSPASSPDVALGPVLQLSAGLHHTCALLQTGGVRCWGSGASGQLGYGNTNNLSAPGGEVVLGGSAVRIATGDAHTCALLNSGGVKCWGAGGHGQLGQASSASLTTPPASVVNVGNAMVYQLVAGGHRTCAVLSTGSVRCWGRNADGELGLGHSRAIGDDEAPSAEGTVNLLPPAGVPVITQTSPSSASVAAGTQVTLQLSASDQTPLTFSWEASFGSLSGATSGATGSQVTWTAPSCMPPDTKAAIVARVTNGLGLTTSHTFRIAVTSTCAYLPSRCQEIRDRRPGAADGIYTIDVDGPGGAGPTLAYCDMTHNGGGWTLMMMMRGTGSAFGYGSTHWSSGSTLNPGVVDPNVDVDMKNEVYGKSTLSGLRLCLDSLTNCLVDSRTALSAQALFASSSTVSAAFSRSTMMAWDPTADHLFGDQPYCNVAGYSVAARFVSCRFGIVMNNENDCGTTDSGIGFGCGGLGAGSITFQNGSYPRRGWIFIR